MTIRITTIGSSLTGGGGWQTFLGEQLQNYVPTQPVQMVTRGIGGAASDVGKLNIAKYVETDPSLAMIEFVNDCHSAKLISVDQAMRNTSEIINGLRAGVPGVKVMLWTTIDPRAPNETLVAIHRYYDMYRYLAYAEDTSFARPDYFFDGAAFFWRVTGLGFASDGVHPTRYGWTHGIMPHLVRYLGPKLATDTFRTPTTSLPSSSWTPVEA